MPQSNLSNLFIDQSEDLIWMLNADFKLTYANKAYLSLMKAVTGEEKKMNDSVFTEGFGKGYVEKWKQYYEKGLAGNTFQIEEHFYHPEANEVFYSQISFHPIKDEQEQIVALVCQSKDTTSLVKKRYEANQLLGASLDVFCTINKRGDFVYVSEAAQSNWGYKPEELTGTAFIKLVVEEDIPITRAIAASIISGEEVKSFMNRYKRKDGGIAYNLWSARWDEASNLVYCVARDARETMEQKKLLQKSEERFRALVQGSSDLIAILDIEGNYTYVSPASASILGIAPEIFLEKNIADFIHPDDRARTLQFLQKITDEKTVRVEPFRFQNSTGEWRWIETVFTNRIDNAMIKGIVANSRDITDKIKEERQRKLLESVITNTNDAVLITEAEPFDEPGPRIIYVNEAFTKMTGYTAAEVIGKTPRMLQGPNSDFEALSRLGKALRKWEVHEITTINYKKSGEEFWVNFTVTPVSDETGWNTHWIAIERDVTEQKNKELELALLAEIGKIFSEEDDLEFACKQTSKRIQEFGKFDLVEIWCVNLEQTYLQLFSQVSSNEHAEISDTAIQKLLKGEGLPGKVWQLKQQQTWDKATMNDLFLRTELRSQLQLHTVAGIPLIFKGEVNGVLVLGSKQDSRFLEKYSGTIQRLESFVASEIKRKKLEADLKHLYDAIPDIIGIADMQCRFLSINKAGSALLGYNKDTLLKNSLKNMILPEDLFRLANVLQSFQQGIVNQSFEARFLTKTGDVILLSLQCRFNPQEELIYLSAKDITEESKLRSLNEQASKLAKIGSWEVDLQNSKIFWSDAVHHLHETDPASFSPELATGISFYRDDFKPVVEDLIRKSVEDGLDFDFEAVIVTKNKKERWVRVIGKPERFNGVTKRIFGSFQDISEIKQTRSRLQSLSNNLPGVVFQYYLYPDGKDELKYVSSGAKNIWGFTPEEAMQNNQQIWKQIEKAGSMEEHKKSIALSIETKSLWKSKWKYVMPNNEVKTHLGYGTPTFLVDGTVVFDSVILDVTEEAKKDELIDQTTQLARIGSWEMDLINQDGDTMYWSPMTRAILECEDSYNPSLTGGFEFYTEESKKRIQQAVDKLIKEGTSFDEELLLITGKGNERWVRCIGQSERVAGQCTKIFGSFQDIHLSKSLELKISEVLSSISDAFYAMDTNWNFTYFNKEAERLLQKRASEVLGKNMWELFPAAVGTSLEAAYKQVIVNNKSNSFEYLFPGDNEWYEVNAYPSNGGVSVYFKNITERKQAAEKLKQAFEERTNILESIGDAFVTVNKEWIVTYWNKQAEKLLNCPKEHIIGKNLWQVYPDAIDTAFYRQYQHAMDTGETVRFEEKYAGIGKWFEVNAYPSPTGLSIYFTDVTLRKEADERLKQANERFEKVTEATNDAIWDWDIENNTLYRAGGFKALFGYEVNKITSTLQSWTEHIHPDDRERVTRSLDAAIQSGQNNWTAEYRYQRKNGTFANVIDRGVVIRDSHATATRMVGAMADISERKRYEEQLLAFNQKLETKTKELQRSNQELEEFAFITSHDLQEPLRMISSFMDQLKRKYGDLLDDKALQYIQFATDGAKRMKQIILDLLLYSRANRPTEQKELINLNEIVSEFLKLRRKLIGEKKAIIHYNNLPVLETYRAPVTQIFHCLLDNALKYSKENVPPIIDIHVKDIGAFYEFAIKDNGIGIDERFYEKIFVIFQRLHNKKDYDGTGIGLSITKRSVEFLGGAIWVESKVGEGSTFYFKILKTINKNV